jgi:hypothetical protein
MPRLSQAVHCFRKAAPGLLPSGYASRVNTRGKVLAVVFYGGLLLVLASVLFVILSKIAPHAISIRIGHNTEGYLAALVAGAWIQYVRPRLTGHRLEWPVVAVVAVVLIAIGVALIATDLPSRFRTLNEAFLALGLLLPYLQLRRPLPRALPAAIAIVLFVGVVIFEQTATVTDAAETFGILILAPIGFDLVDRGILEPAARTSPRVRWSWYAALVVVPIVLSVLEYQVGVSGVFGTAVRYGVRVTEAFVCLLLLELYFAVGLGWTGRRVTAAHRAGSAATVTQG